MDHINPRSWHGDVHLQNVTLLTCWQQGWEAAEADLAAADIAIPFDDMEERTGYNILCPFGGSKIVLVDGTLSAGERDELEEGMLTPNLAENDGEDSNSTGHMPPSLEPDFDDLCAFAAATTPSNLLGSSSEKVATPYDAWVQINPFSSSTLASLGRFKSLTSKVNPQVNYTSYLFPTYDNHKLEGLIMHSSRIYPVQ